MRTVKLVLSILTVSYCDSLVVKAVDFQLVFHMFGPPLTCLSLVDQVVFLTLTQIKCNPNLGTSNCTWYMKKTIMIAIKSEGHWTQSCV